MAGLKIKSPTKQFKNSSVSKILIAREGETQRTSAEVFSYLRISVGVFVNFGRQESNLKIQVK